MKKAIFILLLIIFTLNVYSEANKKTESFKPHSVAEFFIINLKDKYVPGVYDGVKEPKQLPDLVENRKTLVGIDSNGDGVRDDAEIYINRNFKEDYDRILYKEFFKRGNRFFRNAGKLSIEQIQKEIDGFARDTECDRYLYALGYVKDVKEKTNRQFSPYSLLFDTESRQDVYRDTTSKLKMSWSGVSTVEEAYAACPSIIKRKYPKKGKK